jgi:hypothetical protein
MRTFLLLAVTLLGCSHETDQPADVSRQARALAVEDQYFERETRLRFPVPDGVTVDVKHFDPTLPLKKFRHSIHFSTEHTGIAVLIDVWDNPNHRALRPWFEEHLSFLIDADTNQSSREVTTSKVEAIVLEQPRGPQAPSMAVATFLHGEQVFRVTCIDSEGDGSPLPRQLFEQVLATLELEVTP